MQLYNIHVTKRENRQDVAVSLSEYKGKVLLIVNTATSCGLTPQYEALEALYRQYKDRGFVILDFPCNQFMEQAQGDDEHINQFCSTKYDTTFPRFKKIDVNGENESPLYTYLKSTIPTSEVKGNRLMAWILRLSSFINRKSQQKNDIQWNFEKFLVDRQGNVVKRFAPVVKPEHIANEIEKLLIS